MLGKIGRRGSVSRGLSAGVDDGAVAVAAGEAVGSEEDGDGAVGIFVNAHGRLDEMRPEPAGRQLQVEAAPLHRVVVADAALLLDARSEVHTSELQSLMRKQ